MLTKIKKLNILCTYQKIGDYMNSYNGNKKIIVIILVFFAVIGMMTAGLIALSNADFSIKQEPTTTVNADSQGSVNLIPEDENYTSTVNNPEETTSSGITIADVEAQQIQAFISGKYYISSVMVADGTETDMDIAISGTDFYTTMDVDGIEMGMMFRDDNIYLINISEKKYIDFKTIATLMGSQMDFDISELKEVAAVFDLSVYNFHSCDYEETEYEGQPANCYKYYADEISIYFYFVDGVMKRVDYGDANGTINTQIIVNEFSSTIPAGMMSLTGLKKSTLFTFFGDEFLQ